MFPFLGILSNEIPKKSWHEDSRKFITRKAERYTKYTSPSPLIGMESSLPTLEKISAPTPKFFHIQRQHFFVYGIKESYGNTKFNRPPFYLIESEKALGSRLQKIKNLLISLLYIP